MKQTKTMLRLELEAKPEMDANCQLAAMAPMTAMVTGRRSILPVSYTHLTITQDPAVRKAIDDIVFDLYGEENPCNEEDYNLAPSEEMQMGGM